MEELRVLIEATKEKNGEMPSAWFTLPIDEAELEHKLGVTADTEDYHIIEKDLPFSDDVNEDMKIEYLNVLYEMYQVLPPAFQADYDELICCYRGIEELCQFLNEIDFYPDCTSVIEIAREALKKEPAYPSMTEESLRYFDYEAYAQSLEEENTFIKTERGTYVIP